MRFPPQFLDRIRQHYRLSEVIGRRMEIKRRGREYQGLCPFHNEKTPSFTVNDEKGFYHCFGCHAHGDVIGFVKEYDGLSYVQAVESLAREAGMELPKINPEQRRQMERSDQLFQVMEKATNWFGQQLQRAGGAGAKEYLTRRGLSDETLSMFRIGYAPSERDSLMRASMQAGVTEKDLKDVGLLTTPDNGNSYDKFRGRIIFPIRDITGRVVAFGGRLIEEHDKAPKYLNSPETILFHKSDILYNADQARIAAAREGSIIVGEGYMDVIALAQAGFQHAVAPLGTAVTENHIRLLWQLADEPIFCLDADNAGQRAMLRVMELALPHLKPGKSLNFCELPTGEDPDSLIRGRGKEAMQMALDSAVPLSDMLWRTYVGEKKLNTPEQRAGAEQAILRAIDRIQDAVVRKAYVEEIKKRLWESTRGRSPVASSKIPQSRASASLMASLPKENPELWQRARRQQQLIAIVSLCPAMLEDADREDMLASMQCSDNQWESIRAAMMEAHAEEVQTRASMQNAVSRIAGSEALETLTRECIANTTMLGLMKQDEQEGRMLAEHYYRVICNQLQQVALEEELRLIEGQLHLDDEASQRYFQLQQQLRQVRANDQLLNDELSS